MVAHPLSIPRVFHRIWLGGGMPDEFVTYGESFVRHHPAWEMKLWTEDNLPRLRNQRQFDAAVTPAQKADILRYELLHDFGGVYLDTDFECLKPLDPLLAGVRAFSASEDEQWISIGIMGAVPGHPLFREVIEQLPAALRARPAAPINEQTGPLFFTRIAAARRLKGLDEDVVIFPPKLFYPYRIGEERLREHGFPHAYAVHHWAGSWLPNTLHARTPPAAGAASASTEQAQTHMDKEVARVVLGLDPERPQAALAVLLAYRRLFGPSDAVELSIYAYAEPSLPLLECIQILLRTFVGAPEEMAPITLLSRAELGELAFATAFFTSGDEVRDADRLCNVMQDLHALRARLGAPPLGMKSGQKLTRDEVLHLAAHRPQQHSATLGPTNAPDSTGSSSVGPEVRPLCGTALGNGRVLVKTNVGFPVLCSARDLSLTPELMLYGEYDRPLWRFLEARLSPGQVAFDIGANIGLFTTLMARTVGEAGHVVAYEVVRENYQLLVDNISMNYLTERCTLLEQAAWDKREKLKFFAPSKFLGNGSLCTNVAEYAARYPGDELEVIEVDAVPVMEQLNRFERVALVKVDVEGAEYRVMQGMSAAISSGRVQLVVFECVQSLLGRDFERLVRLLAELETGQGLRCFSLTRDGRLEHLPLELLASHGNFTQVVLTRG